LGTQVELLVGLQTIDQQLRERTDAIEALRHRMVELDAELDEQRKKLELVRAERAELETRRRDLEGSLSSEESKMKERRMRLNRIRNEKEASAVRREIELGKEAGQKLEEDMLVLYEALDGVGTRETELKEMVDGLSTRREEEHARMTDEIATLSHGLDDARHRREEIAREVEAPLRRQYENILGRRRGLVVVEVRDNSCQGCHMRIAPQLANEIRRNQSVILCPSCHRILYLRPEAAVSEA
jgi:predicted  nucleic acid-binding Zn-ribbon protein